MNDIEYKEKTELIKVYKMVRVNPFSSVNRFILKNQLTHEQQIETRNMIKEIADKEIPKEFELLKERIINEMFSNLDSNDFRDNNIDIELKSIENCVAVSEKGLLDKYNYIPNEKICSLFEGLNYTSFETKLKDIIDSEGCSIIEIIKDFLDIRHKLYLYKSDRFNDEMYRGIESYFKSINPKEYIDKYVDNEIDKDSKKAFTYILSHSNLNEQGRIDILDMVTKAYFKNNKKEFLECYLKYFCTFNQVKMNMVYILYEEYKNNIITINDIISSFNIYNDKNLFDGLEIKDKDMLFNINSIDDIYIKIRYMRVFEESIKNVG